VPGTITVRANPPGYTFYIVGGAIVAVILVFGIVRSLRRSRTASRVRTAGPVTPPVAPGSDGLDERAPTPAPEDPAVASASPVPGPDSAPRRMTDDRT
jgi:hypothetical protein